ncbi:hypothetical protein [Lebetimonas sp. JH292]|uniref:hypothetical protein n=1 Tax=Lebetimonas sp. JH292 TaxID=990068 RepID=UPI0004B445C4|nr:hypothetical protein [Lebetimonas sp. JH292]
MKEDDMRYSVVDKPNFKVLKINFFENVKKNKMKGYIMRKEAVLNIDFKELSKQCKTQEDISKLTKEFMKNMIENMLKAVGQKMRM